MKPFRFGATVAATGTRAAWADTVRAVASAGFDVLTVMDHFTSGGIWGPLVAAHEIAPSLRLGTIVLNGDLWNPSILAREAATVDRLTDGALELGIGAGWDLRDYAAAGVEREPAKVRIARLAESLQIIRSALAGEHVQLAGEHRTVDGGEPWPPAAQSRLPILVGGGARPILELAARTADIVSVHRNLDQGVAASWSADLDPTGRFSRAVDERIGWVRAAAGDRFDALELHAILLKVAVTDRRDEVAAELAENHALPAEAILASPHYLIGTIDEIADDLVARRERWGISYWTLVAGNDLAAFAPIAARVAGR
ncbi:MAG: TIGR03621 family F420-dependent LLM class oxidoreductase [Actinomycetota bacterium]